MERGSIIIRPQFVSCDYEKSVHAIISPSLVLAPLQNPPDPMWLDAEDDIHGLLMDQNMTHA